MKHPDNVEGHLADTITAIACGALISHGFFTALYYAAKYF